MALSLIDPNSVSLIGENLILRLKDNPASADRSLCSFWRVLHSPAGPGHTLFIRSDALDGEAHLFSDSPELARFMQTFEALMRPDFARPEIPVETASYSRSQEGTSLYRETAITERGEIALTWRDLAAPFMTRLESNNRFVGKWSVYSCLVPAARASLAVNAVRAQGSAFPDELEGHATSTCFLALGEVWLAPVTLAAPKEV